MILTAFAAASIIATCPWADRGLDRFGGDLVATVATYRDIPAPALKEIQRKMSARKYDDITHMTATGNSSEAWRYGPPTMMHFGTKGKVCRTVDTSMWSPNDPGERGLVYCADGHCVVVWTVCRNLSRIQRLSPISKPPQSAMVPDIPPASFDFPPVAVSIDPPSIVADSPGVVLPPQTFARLSSPDPDPPEYDPHRIDADQPFADYRPLLWPLRRFPTVGDGVVPTYGESQPVGPILPVPGVVPPIFSQTTPFSPDVLPSGPQNVAAVPEMKTWALMLLGLLGVGLMVRRNV